MVGLPALILCTQIKCARMLEIRGEDNGLVTGLAGQLDAEIPGIEGYKGKLVVLGDDVLLCKGIESVNGIAEGPGVPDLVPGEGCQARCEGIKSARRGCRAGG